MAVQRWIGVALLVLAGAPSAGWAAAVVVSLPSAVRVAQATAVAMKDPGNPRTGAVAPGTVTFADLRPDTAYEVRLTLADGTVLQGVDLGWYSRVPDKANAGPLTEDDRQQMTAIRTGVLSFFNHADEVVVRGNHNRAVMLVDQRRDAPFHSDKGDEVIWRPELWYFENHHGGWEKVQQAARVLRRERFPTTAAYHAVVDHLRWVPELGGLKVRPGGPDVTVSLPLTTPATQPTPAK